MSVIAILVAAGRGRRIADEPGSELNAPKQYADVAGRTVLARAIAPFVNHQGIDHVLAVIHADDESLYLPVAEGISIEKLLPAVHGGATRQASVFAGLRAIENRKPELVLIHDAARPFVSTSDIDGVLGALAETSGAILAVQVVDTLKKGAGLVSGTLPRDGLWRAQTPQGFRYPEILSAHDAAAASGRSDFTDDASIAEFAGLDVALVAGSERNFKITSREDLARAEKETAMSSEYRTGSGFDVHKFTDGDHVWLCGLKVPHTQALLGHSDADVAMHAVTDAIYGALADGDIGSHFPPSDPRWKGAASHIFLAHAGGRVSARGGVVVNIDVTILCEEPKIGPHRDAMRAKLAEILEIDVDRVAVKATTTEGLGFTGRREGIAAMASATVRFD
jgi:2-C-methyl-D-erythritol 4-phosphate cytidylyltransferase / 2-C-methyl-D-erythritol 2,4-cyclodiphosphate synthase